MNHFTPSMLAAAAIVAISIGGASAMPFDKGPAALSENLVQDARVVCDRNGRCYNTNRRARSSQRYYAPRRNGYNDGYHGYNNGYYAQPHYRAYDGPAVGVGIGPFGFGIY
jgi:hypothetical protein